jgi:uncharacterized membrane protein
MQGTSEQAVYLLWVERGAIVIEALAVALIVGFILTATCGWVLRVVRERDFTLEHYEHYRSTLGRALLLGLEILVAADVVRTVALEPTLVNVATLGLLVVIRTFLSWSIVLEVEGRWPWQPRADAARTTGRAS